jgi:hypothetical protein
MRLKIASIGEPVLRSVTCELSKEQILSPSIQRLIEYMRDTVRDAPGTSTDIAGLFISSVAILSVEVI